MSCHHLAKVHLLIAFTISITNLSFSFWVQLHVGGRCCDLVNLHCLHLAALCVSPNLLINFVAPLPLGLC